ncbi:MAG: hypothetical protein IJ379_11895 [Lachnospiraceae bacterium]|nr:hypothetical protein [Lachnospiraceae bacterium]
MAKNRRRKISLQANFQPEFTDLTREPFVYHYPEEEIVEGIRFVHMQKGVYKAIEGFLVTKEKMQDIRKRYGGMIFWGYKRGEECEIRFALSEMGCSLDYDRWWMDEAFIDSAEIAKAKNEIRDMDRFYSDYSAPRCNCMSFSFEREVREDGTIPHIMINGYIADMVEPGIYYFPEQKGRRVPRININSHFENKDVAAVFYWDYGITQHIFLQYVATDKRYFSRLKEIAEMEAEYRYHEFVKKGMDDEEACPVALDIEEFSKEVSCPEGEEFSKEVFYPEGEELIAGLGTENVILSFDVPLVAKREFKTYHHVYKVGDILILIREDGGEKVKEEFNMRLMTRLAVKKRVYLNSGYWYEPILKIIDCREEKYREILTPEAYRLYEKMWKIEE